MAALTRIGVAVLIAMISIGAQAKTIDITLGADGKSFSPDFQWLETGDRVRFAANAADHLVTTIPGMLPDGVPAARQTPNRPLAVTLAKDGVYGFACCGDDAQGAVALFIAGKPANEGAAKRVKHKTAAQQRFTALFARLDGTP